MQCKNCMESARAFRKFCVTTTRRRRENFEDFKWKKQRANRAPGYRQQAAGSRQQAPGESVTARLSSFNARNGT
ncbi:unnamed protein product [Ceratitis capitata]|uniref:(Mediterranean fruit fly) hypothetical protein n=1 Tax=Ceratitis capitata TaxID=7213 RepID=A0A811UKH5_CERCA|nr:unnamed protein product [Ceratitis capitata]